MKVLYDFCGLSTDDEYSLHHDSPDAVTVQDIKFVENIIDFVERRNNPFKKDNCSIVKNSATGTIINQDATDFLVSNIAEKLMKTLLMSVFQNNQRSFWTLFPKRKIRSGKQTKPLDVQEQNIKALKYIDYACLRVYEI